MALVSRAYSEAFSPRLCRSAARLIAIGLVATMGLATGGCSTSYKLSALTGSAKTEEPADRTASVAPAVSSSNVPRTTAEADLVFVRAAAVELLARGAKDISQPWENPRTGARGTVTPVADMYTRDGATCRDFLASYMRGSIESWYRGEACQKGARWQVKEIRPLQRT